MVITASRKPLRRPIRAMMKEAGIVKKADAYHWIAIGSASSALFSARLAPTNADTVTNSIIDVLVSAQQANSRPILRL